MEAFKERKLISAWLVDAVNGSFALDKTPLVFEHCRERFGKQWDRKTKGFYLKHPTDKGANIAAFIIKTEEILGKKRHSRFAETNFQSVLWIEPAAFWRCCRMRRSLFTILVRTGWNYHPANDYEDVLFNDPYFQRTRQAVMRFLFGFTKYVGPTLETSGSNIESIGWKAIFNNRDAAYVRAALVWPRKNNPHTCVRNYLWN